MIKSRTRNDVLATPTLQYLKIEQMAKDRVHETSRRNRNKIRQNTFRIKRNELFV